MVLQTSGQISHDDIMAEFSEPAGAWRLSQDGGLLLQSVGDPKGPGSMIRETDFYGISAVQPAPTGTFLMRPNFMWENYQAYFYYSFQQGFMVLYGGHDRAVGSGAYDASGNATGENLNAGPSAIGPFPDQTLGPWFYWAGVNLQSQLGAGAWDASWVMNTFQIVYQVSNVTAPLPGGFGMSSSMGPGNLQQIYPANPSRPAVGNSPTWQRAFGAQATTTSIFVPNGGNFSFTKGWFLTSFNQLMGAGATVSTAHTQNPQAVNNGWTMQQCAAETLNWHHPCEFRRGYIATWRDTYITMSFA